MERYFYHGIEGYYGNFGNTMEIVLKILQEGLKTRNEVNSHSNDEFEHVCLYKKNEELDYSDPSILYKSARAGWIDNCFVFIISNDIEANKATEDMTNLIDEWRSVGSIPPNKIIGLALPLNSIKEYLSDKVDDEETIEDQNKLNKMLPIITEYILEKNLLLLDSEIPNFTDELDKTLNNNFKK